MSVERVQKRLGLALSGGGTRAACFHFGVLLRLAHEDLLEHVTAISTVSGGSLGIAALISANSSAWPSSRLYREVLYPKLREILTTTDLFSLAALLSIQSILRNHLKLIGARAEVLSDRLRSEWRVSGRLANLPANPIWWINASTIDTGKNWRFSRSEMGDWKFGRHYSPDVALADAVAASAAVPYVIGALKLPIPRGGWYRTDPATRQPKQAIDPPSKVLRLWDGGAYDNLGLEALFKAGKPSSHWDFLVCSDASSVLGRPDAGGISNLHKGNLASPRLFDLMGDQVRSLRSRMLMRELERGTARGVIVRMGQSTRDIDLKVGADGLKADYSQYLSDEQVRLAVDHATTLNRLQRSDFDLLARHGFECLDRTLSAHAAAEGHCSLVWPS